MTRPISGFRRPALSATLCCPASCERTAAHLDLRSRLPETRPCLCLCCCQARAWPAMRNELQRATLPGLGERECAAGRARNRQSLEAGRFKILGQHADRIAADHVLRSRNGIRGNRNAAGQRLELNDAECVGSAGKHEYVCCREMCCQSLPFQLTEKMG